MLRASEGLRGLKILLVDDSIESLDLIRSMLTDIGITQVTTAKDGVEAMDFLRASEGGSVDVILCDCRMPRMTGLDVLKQVRIHDSDVAFVMISGAADRDSVAEAKSNGVTSYIKKPFSADELRKKLEVISGAAQYQHSRVAG